MSDIEYYQMVDELEDKALRKIDFAATWLPAGGAISAILSGALAWFGCDKFAGVAGALGGISTAAGITFAVRASQERDRRMWNARVGGDVAQQTADRNASHSDFG